jgi:hypothetical protein
VSTKQTGRVTRGFEFTHDHILDPDWEPRPGEKYVRDCPKARMVVTRAEDTIWYGYARTDGGRVKGQWAMGRDKFEEKFGGKS